MVKVLHTRNATLWYTTFYTYTHFNFDLKLLHYLDTCKARSANKKIMSKKKKRIDAIVFHLEKKGILVSKENVDSGTFPWHNSKQRMFS